MIVVAIWSGKYWLPSYQNIFIYKIEKCHLLAIAAVIIRMSTELSDHQNSETAVTIFRSVLWTEL